MFDFYVVVEKTEHTIRKHYYYCQQRERVTSVEREKTASKCANYENHSAHCWRALLAFMPVYVMKYCLACLEFFD